MGSLQLDTPYTCRSRRTHAYPHDSCVRMEAQRNLADPLPRILTRNEGWVNHPR